MSEKVTIKVERKKLHLPTIALRGLVVFPNNLVHFEVGREKSIAAVEWAMANNSNVFLVAQKSMDTTEPQQADLFSYGVVAEVKQVLRVSGDLVKVLVEGKYRAKLSALDASGDFLLSEVRPAPVRAGKADDAVETEALLVTGCRISRIRCCQKISLLRNDKCRDTEILTSRCSLCKRLVLCYMLCCRVDRTCFQQVCCVCFRCRKHSYCKTTNKSCSKPLFPQFSFFILFHSFLLIFPPVIIQIYYIFTVLSSKKKPSYSTCML